MSNRIWSLLMRSGQLADAIAAEERRTKPSGLRLLRLKRLRLVLARRLQQMLCNLAQPPAPQARLSPARIPAAPRRLRVG